MLGRVVESLTFKIGEKLLEYAQGTYMATGDYKCTIETLGRSLKSLSAKASDVEEEIKKAELSGKKKRKRDVENWLTEVQKLETEFVEWRGDVESGGFIRRFLGGDRAKQLKERVDGLIERSINFGGLLLDVHETRGEELPTRSLVGKEFWKTLEKIWEFLVVDKVSSVGIYGMGGAGKTTLAKHVNNQLIEKAHECVYWVTVSRDCSIMMLQDKIARKIELNLSDEHDEDVRAARLKRGLSQRKNFVLILDDVWEKIDLLKVGDPLSLEGCRLMITARSSRVCRQSECKKVIEVKTLEKDEAWDLFTKTLGQETTLNLEIQKIAMSVAEQCGGLPLGIITIAGSLKCVTDVHEWNHVLDKLETSNMGEEDGEYKEVFKALKCSFDRLASRKLQLCFLYCCLYPEDYPIPREELINKFISEEMLDQKGRRKRQLHEGHYILNKLVDACLLESSRNFMNEDLVKMHDLVRDMALTITKGQYEAICGNRSLKVIPDEERYWTKDLEKMSLMNNGICKIPDGMSPNCSKLSTLLLGGNLYLQVIPSSFFSQMYGLCTLDLSGCGQLESVPYIGKLTALRELNLSETAIDEVPHGMEKLVSLRCLKMRDVDLEKLPSGLLLNFPELQCLHLPLAIQAPVEEIERLKWLEDFVGRVKDLCDFNRLYKRLQSMGHSELYGVAVGDYLSKLYLHWHIAEVAMGGSVLKKEEGKDAVMLAAQDIQRLSFVECEGMSNCLLDDFARSNINPKSLRILIIQNCGGVECILKREQFLMAKEESECKSFQMLEVMVLRGLPDFVGAMMFQTPASPLPTQVVFSNLKELMVRRCDKMKTLGLPASELQSLEYLNVGGCEEMEEIIEVVAAGDEGRGGEQGDQLARVLLPRLEVLELEHLPRLKSICGATMVCDSIGWIKIRGCPSLKRLPLYFPAGSGADEIIGQPGAYSTPPTLKLKRINTEREWWESLEWEHPSHKHLLQLFVDFDI